MGLKVCLGQLTMHKKEVRLWGPAFHHCYHCFMIRRITTIIVVSTLDLFI